MRQKIWLSTPILGACLGVTSALAVPATDPTTVIRQVGLRDGQWRTTIRIAAAEIKPSKKGGVVPATAIAELRKKIGTSFSTNDCIGSRLDAKGDLILPGIKISHQCRLENLLVKVSKFNLVADCGSGSEGFRATTSIRSDFNPSRMISNIKTTTFSQNAGLITNMTLVASSTYVGQCQLH